MKKITYYWHDALNDDFAKTKIKTKPVPKNYKYYSRNFFYLFAETCWKIIAVPVAWIMLKVGYLHRIKNRKVLRQAKKSGCFIYANHTDYLLDAYVPSLVGFPKKTHIITISDATSIPGLGWLVKMLGALPIPSTMQELVKFKEAILTLSKKHHRAIMIYPEAHLWCFYTDIRPFVSKSFYYPVETGLPTFAVTNIFVKRKCKWIRFPKVVTYVDGPFYPDTSLSQAEQVENLRNQVYEAMKKRIDSHPHYYYRDYVYVDDPSKTGKVVTKVSRKEAKEKPQG